MRFRMRDLANVHNSNNQVLRDRANKIESTDQNRTVALTSAAMVGDITFAGGLHTMVLVSTKLGTSIHYSRRLKKHNEKANAVLESERTVILALLEAFKRLELACSNLRRVGRLPSHVDTVSMVDIAFSPGGRMALTHLALEGIQQDIVSYPEASLHVGISAVMAAMHLIEAVGVETTLSAVECATAAVHVLPVLGLLINIRELSIAVKTRGESEGAEMLRVIIATRERNFKPMLESVNLLYGCGINSKNK